MRLVRLVTTGSVDDGKSTLVGRLLYDQDALYTDQIEAIKRASRQDHFNMAYVTDGLKSEREQGITIDVAYRYFSSQKHRFILIDSPGHVQYTRNMFTGASQADVGLILVDASKGILEQTLRHLYILALLGVNQIAVVINKMDLVDHSHVLYEEIVGRFNPFLKKLGSRSRFTFIPVSALSGSNVVHASPQMSWYHGQPLVSFLDSCVPECLDSNAHFRLPVQHVISVPRRTGYYRGYSGTISSGHICVGDKVVVLPSRQTNQISQIGHHLSLVSSGSASDAVSVCMEDDIGINRGDMIVKHGEPMPDEVTEFDVTLCWFSHQHTLDMSCRYRLQHTTRWVWARIAAVNGQVDIATLDIGKAARQVGVNDIVWVTINVSGPIFFDHYYHHRSMGSFILVHEITHQTVAAGIYPCLVGPS